MSTLLSGMFLLMPDIHISPLSLTGTRTPQAQAARGYAGTTWPDRYRGISSMVSHWECRPSVWEHPGRVKAGKRRPPGGDARTLWYTCMQMGGDLKWARNPTLLIPWTSNGHEIPPCWSRGVGGGREDPGNANSRGEYLPPMPQPDTPCQV